MENTEDWSCSVLSPRVLLLNLHNPAVCAVPSSLGCRSFCRPVERSEEGDSGHPAYGVEDLPLTLHHQRLRLLRPPHRHLQQQPQTGLLQRQPQGGELHVSPQLRWLSGQVSLFFLPLEEPWIEGIMMFSSNPFAPAFSRCHSQ